ncbi:MAG: helix-turn-helix transcriptional regulator [Gammaproteobacteria bacterium]|nr:helix-turn-helix transcriptional regulator [Gammaproteobacteria bacterium]
MTKRTKQYRCIFAKNLRRIRHLQELSQEDLALKSGLHRTYIGSVERKERNISIDNMERLATALKVSLIDLLNDCDEAT